MDLYLASIVSTASMGSLPRLPPWRVPMDCPCHSRLSRSLSLHSSINSRLSLKPLGGNSVMSSTELSGPAAREQKAKHKRYVLVNLAYFPIDVRSLCNLIYLHKIPSLLFYKLTHIIYQLKRIRIYIIPTTLNLSFGVYVTFTKIIIVCNYNKRWAATEKRAWKLKRKNTYGKKNDDLFKLWCISRRAKLEIDNGTVSAMWKQTNLGYLRVDRPLGWRLRRLPRDGEPSLLDSVLDSTPRENTSVVFLFLFRNKNSLGRLM